MTKPTITIEDIIAYHEAEAERYAVWSFFFYSRRRDKTVAEWHAHAAASHREAAALLRKGLDE